VTKGETDTRLDTAAAYLKDLIFAVNNMNENLGGKIDRINENLGGKMDRMLDKQDELLVEVKDIGQKQDELLVEVRDVNRKFDKVLYRDIAELKGDMAEVKAALRAKGII
jgi:seryl-tRNA synthetase